VAFFGLGLMGSEMAKRLVDSHKWKVVVWNRNGEKAKEFQKNNPTSEAAPTTIEAISLCEVIVVMLTDWKAMHDSLFPQGAMNHLTGKVVIQMCTIGSQESINFASEVQAHGGRYMECPVLGTTPAAQAGTLQLLLTCGQDCIEKYREVLETMGIIRYLGEVYGKSSVLKLALNHIIAMQMAAISVSTALVQTQGVSVDLFWDIVKGSTFHSKYFEMKMPKITSRNYSNPTFSTNNILKDVKLVEEELTLANLNTASVEGIKILIEDAVQSGYGESDMAAIVEGVLKVHKDE